MADEKATIDIMKDGPFIVNNLPVLENSKGDILEINNKAALCRCGASANKPFCDWTHSKIGFNGNRVSKLKLDKEIEYKGKNISIYYNPSLCYHAAECVGNLPQVFNSKAKPWINPDNSDNDSIINTIKKCPSGALSYKVGEVHERSTGADRKIIIEKNGPYCISGHIELHTEEDQRIASNDHYALCRCGASKNKPYCDGSHVKSGFVDNDN